jgi:hypothetical protein
MFSWQLRENYATSRRHVVEHTVVAAEIRVKIHCCRDGAHGSVISCESCCDRAF